ncbi:hypothetical protein OSTOST_11520 [Ostertagia ostertagi]
MPPDFYHLTSSGDYSKRPQLSCALHHILHPDVILSSEYDTSMPPDFYHLTSSVDTATSVPPDFYHLTSSGDYSKRPQLSCALHHILHPDVILSRASLNSPAPFLTSFYQIILAVNTNTSMPPDFYHLTSSGDYSKRPQLSCALHHILHPDVILSRSVNVKRSIPPFEVNTTTSMPPDFYHLTSSGDYSKRPQLSCALHHILHPDVILSRVNTNTSMPPDFYHLTSRGDYSEPSSILLPLHHIPTPRLNTTTSMPPDFYHLTSSGDYSKRPQLSCALHHILHPDVILSSEYDHFHAS